MQHTREKATTGLAVALALAVAFLLLCYLKTWGDLTSALFGGRVIDSTLSQPILGTRLGARLAGFAVAMVSVHLLLGVLSWLLAHASRRAWPASRNGLRAWSACWFVLLASWVLIANAAWFPHASLGEPYHELVRSEVFGVDVLMVVTAGIGAMLAYVGGRLVWCELLSSRAARRRCLWALPPMALIGLAPFLVAALRSPDIQPAFEQPNVVIVGIDSLRSDYVRRPQSLTPAIDGYLSGAVVFPNTVTPLARTFPAWVSIVSGRHPHTTGAVINLFPRHLIDDGQTLPDLMREAGYRTTYAIDEVRFSNLDSSYGFDQMITPPIGSADFLLGYVYDVPLHNLILNTPVGRALFPFSYSNRAAAATYDPDTFIEWLDDELRFDRPTLLATHFTLPHWPYTWATSSPVVAPTKNERTRLRYESTVRRVDRQFRDLMALLERRGVLDNAIVVVLSDHGESLGERDLVTWHGEPGSELFGHGTNVFSSEQYQVLLAMRFYGRAKPGRDGPPEIDVPVSLEDIAPTFVDLLDLASDSEFDGRSLAPLLQDEDVGADTWDERIRFVETEYNPPGFAIGDVPGTSQLEKAAQTYNIDPVTDRLSVRPDMLEEIMASRQFAAEHQGAILGAIPVGRDGDQHLIFADSDRSAVWLPAPPGPHDDPRVNRMWEALQQRFETVGSRKIVLPPSSD